MYVWDYEIVRVNGKEEKFVVVDVIDLPVELVSSNGLYYALYIKDVEDGELWFLIEGVPLKTLAGYLKGETPIGEIFKKGKVKIVKRLYEEYDVFVDTKFSTQDFRPPEGSLILEMCDLKVYEDFVKMFDKPFRKLLIVNTISQRLKDVIKINQPAIEVRRFKYNIKIDMPMVYAA